MVCNCVVVTLLHEEAYTFLVRRYTFSLEHSPYNGKYNYQPANPSLQTTSPMVFMILYGLQALKDSLIGELREEY